MDRQLGSSAPLRIARFDRYAKVPRVSAYTSRPVEMLQRNDLSLIACMLIEPALYHGSESCSNSRH